MRFHKKPKIVIAIPAWNEEKTLGKAIEEIRSVMSKTEYDYKIHVQNDGSKDKTVVVAKAHGAIIHSNPRNLGLAETFKQEIVHSLDMGADIIVHTDADGQYVATGIPKLIAKVEQGYDLVLGSRFKGHIESMPLMKRIGNKAFARAFSKMVGIKLTDTTTGFRAFTAEVARDIEFINDFTYTQEQIIRAGKQNFKIIEIPIKARKTRDSRLFKSPLEYAIKAWINIIRIYRDYNPIKMFGSVGVSLMGLGFIIALYVLVSTAWLGWSSLDNRVPTIVLAVLFFLTGLQVLLFGFLADKK